jgi:hypothetical protein
MPTSEKRVVDPSADVELPCAIFAFASTKRPWPEPLAPLAPVLPVLPVDPAVDPPVEPEPLPVAEPVLPAEPVVPVPPEPLMPVPLFCWTQPVTVTVWFEPLCVDPLRWSPDVPGVVCVCALNVSALAIVIAVMLP